MLSKTAASRTRRHPGDRTSSTMEDGFRLKEGMFFTVRCQVDDVRVLRLKELVMGCMMNSYEPEPFHFSREMRRHVADQHARELKKKTSEDGIPKSSGKSKVQQLWLTEHKKFSQEIQQTKPEQKRKSMEVKPSEKSESRKVSAAKTGSETRVSNDSPVAPRDEAEATKHESVQVNSVSGIPTVNNGPTQSSSSSSSAHQPSSLNVLRDSWGRFLRRMRSERPARKRLPMFHLERLLTKGGEQAIFGQTGTTTATTNRHSRITQTSAAQISKPLSLPANDRVKTAPAHQNPATHLATDSSGNRKSTVQHTLGTSLIDRSASKRLHQENNSSIPAKHQKISISDGSKGNRQASVSIAQKYSNPEEKTTCWNIVSIDRCASKRFHQEDSSIPSKHRKVPISYDSTRNRQVSSSIAQKHSTPKK